MKPGWRLLVAWPVGPGLVIGGLLLAILSVSLQRTHFGMFAESDFTGSFGPEAQRILAGVSLALEFHPPGYAFAVALARLATGSWLIGGLWLSGLSAAIFLLASVAAFRRMAGTAAGWGALAACACSAVFFSSASTVASDMLFAALISLSLALVARASDTPHRYVLWLGAGVAAALAFLTRTNGLAAAAVLLASLLAPVDRAIRLRGLGAVALGFVLPLLFWAIYASATSSPLAPSGTHLNLAVAAYGAGTEAWGDRAAEMQPQFKNLMEVIAHDPGAMALQLTRRLLSLPRHFMFSLTWPPLVALAVPGVLLMLWRRRTPAFLVYLLVIAGLTLLSGIVEYQARYHLVLIPLFGGMAGVTCGMLVKRFVHKPIGRALLGLAVLLIVGVVSVRAHGTVISRLEGNMQREIAEAIPHVLERTDSQATIYARKSNLAFETGRVFRMLPNVSTAPMLHRALCEAPAHGVPAYLYFGTMERSYRRQLDDELNVAPPIPWLEPIASGVKAQWSLYRIRLQCPKNGTPAPQNH